MKRFLALLVSLALTLSLCTFASAEEYTKHLHIDIGNWDVPSGTDMDAINQLVCDRFNIDVTWFNEDWGNYEETIALWGTADTLPDVFTGYIDESWFGDFISQKMIRDIPLETLQKYPNLYAEWKADAACQMLYKAYDKIYYFPRNDTLNAPYEGSYTGGMGLYYRSDWAEKLGFGEPTNMDELLVMLTAFAEQDPDGDGQKNTYGLSTTFSRLEGLWSWFNCYPDYWVNGKEGVMPGYLDRERMLDALTWLRKAYQAGAIDPEWQGAIDGFVNGTFGAYTYHLNCGWACGIVNEKFGTSNRELGNAMEIINNLTCLPPHEGAGRTTRPYFMDGMAVFSYDCADEIMERMLAVWEWSLTDEGWMETNFGVEGIDYTLDEGGHPVRTEAWNTRSTQAKIAGMTSWGGGEWVEKYADFKALPEGVTAKDMIEYGMKLVRIANEACHNPDVTFNMAASLITTDERASFMFDYRGGLLDIVTGTEDVAVMYDAFVANAYSAGVQAVIDAENAALADQ